MIKKGTRYLLLTLLFISMCICANALLFKSSKKIHISSFKPVEAKKSTTKTGKIKHVFAGQITNFVIPEEIAPAIIDQTHGVIGIAVHASQDITNLKPTVIDVTPGSTVTPGVGAPNDFTNAPLYTVDPLTTPVHYNVQVFHAGTATTCSNTPKTLNGTSPPPTGTYQWQILDESTHSWSDAPGSTSSSTDYTTQAIVNNTSSPVIYTFRRSIITMVGTAYDSYVDLTVNPVIAITGNTITQPSPANSTFCVNGDPGTIAPDNPPLGGNGTYTYQWQSSTGSGFSNINNAVGATYTTGTITTTTSYQRVVTSGDCTPPTTSNLVTITIQPAIANNHLSDPGATTFCSTSSPLSLHDSFTPTGGSGTYSYQWQSCTDGVNFADINTSAARQRDYNSPAITQTTYFRRMVSSGTCSVSPSDNIITITIQKGLSANTISPSGFFCSTGNPGQITGTPVSGGDETPAYSWESSPDGSNWQLIPTATGKDYTPTAAITATTYYHRIVTSGSCSTPSISTPVIFNVTPAITANTIHTATETFCASSGPFTINGDPPAGGNGSFTYQWQSSPDNSTYSPIQSATLTSYDSPSLITTTWFRRVVSSGACDGTSISTPLKITVYPALAGNNITAPPVAAFCQSGDAEAITGLVPTGGDGSPSYQWQQSPDNVDAHFTNISGETGQNFDPPSLTSTMFYRRVITELICTTPLISNVIEIHITQPLDPASNLITNPLTTTFCTSYDPNTITGNFGYDINGKIPSGEDAIVYRWFKSTDNGTNWLPITVNGNSPDYDPDPITVTTWYKRTIQSGKCATPVNSSTIVKLNIIPSPPNITINQAPLVCSGEQATLSVTSPDAALTYYWYDTPARDNLLYQGPVFKTEKLTTTQTFYAEASNGTCSSPQLASVTVTVNQLPGVPVIAEIPNGCQGSSVTLKVANPQSGITYKWYTAATNGTPLFTGAEFTTPALTAGVSYYVDATNSSGCISTTRAEAGITVYPLPVAVAQGANICRGTIATLTANNPDPDEVINWYDTPTGGTSLFTGSSFNTPVLTGNKTYYAEAVNTVSGCVSAVRAPADVKILTPLPSPVIHVSAAVAPEITFTWLPVDGAVAYRVSTDNGASYNDPTTGPNGTSYTVTGLQIGQRVTIIVHALGNESCETGPDSNPVTGVTTDPDVDKIYVANAFTPNGDGKNDIIYVHNDKIKSIKFLVYDQWGNMLFESLSPQKGWDGTYKGKVEPAGVYVYYLEAIMNDGQPVTKKGTITLLR